MTQNNGSTSNPAGMICAEEYVVKRGDSFYLISHKLGVPLRDLLAANRDIHPARLMVGDVLCIPREEDHATTDNGLGMNGGNINPLSPANSTLSDMQAEMNNGAAGQGGAGSANGATEWPESPEETSPNGEAGTNGEPEANGEPGLTCPMDEQMTVQTGQTVADIQLRGLVSRNTLTTANPTVDLESLEAGQVLCVPKENIPCPIPSTYTLGEGETLESVAIRFNLPVAAILRANPCLAPQDFEEGVTAILPR